MKPGGGGISDFPRIPLVPESLPRRKAVNVTRTRPPAAAPRSVPATRSGWLTSDGGRRRPQLSPRASCFGCTLAPNRVSARLCGAKVLISLLLFKKILAIAEHNLNLKGFTGIRALVSSRRLCSLFLLVCLPGSAPTLPVGVGHVTFGGPCQPLAV